MGAQLDTWQVVEAPPVVPLPFGLFSVAELRLPTDEHWRLGVQWQSQACSTTKATTGPCIDPEVEPLTPDAYCSVSQFEPFTVYAYNDDAIPGHTLEQHRDNAVARLVATEQRTAEEQFFAAVMGSGLTVTDLTGAPLGVALGFVEQNLATNYGGQGVIHMSRHLATILWEYLEVQGGRLVTKLGTPVIAGAGYGNNPVPPVNEGHIVGTGPVVIYRGDVDTRETANNTSRNQVSYIAQRDYVVGWDCFATAAKVNLDPSIPIS
jgi:hypothetical protein